MVTTKLNLSMTEPQVRQIYAKQGDTGRVLDITLDQTPEDGTLRILRPDGVEVTSEAVTGGEVSGSTFESLTEADVTELTVGIEPVQDLNGYDKPWVGGAGKNLFHINEQTLDGITVSLNADGSYKLNGSTSSSAVFLRSNVYTLKTGTYHLSASSSSSSNFLVRVRNADTSTLIVSITADGGNGVGVAVDTDTNVWLEITVFANSTLSNVNVYPQLEKGTTKTSFEPYSNICPITGHDEVTVFDTAEQMYDPSQVVIGRNWTGGSADNRAVFKFVPTPNVSYEIVTVGGNFSDILFLQMNNGTILSNTGILPSRTPMTITIADNCNRVIIQFNKDSAITTSDFLDFECSVSTKTNTYTTSLGQTVYGGTLDLVSGVLTVTDAMMDMGSLTWRENGAITGGMQYASVISDKKVGETNFICSAFATSYPITTIGYICGRAASKTVAANSPITTLADFVTSVTGQTIVYELETPQTIQLTPQQIKTLVGANNVWASSGDIVNITFTYGGLLSEIPSEATEIVGKCYCDVEQNGVSSMPFTLNVKKNERQ